MELKSGYKRTEVGVIPEEWPVDRLDKFWSVTDCKHVTAKFVASGYPLASIKEVQSRYVELADAKQTTRQFYDQLTEGGRAPRVGDLIISRNATVGEVAQVADWHPPFAMGQDVCLMRKRDQEYSTDYLQAVFRSPVIARQLADLMVGSTFKRINVQQIKGFCVPMPLPREQRTIATALSDVDALLTQLDRLIAKKRDIKQAAMQQLLTGKTRLPGFGGEWGKTTLGALATFFKGKGLPKDHINEFVGQPCIHYGELFTHYGETITEVRGRTTHTSSVFRSEENDVLMPTSDVTPTGLAKASCVRANGIVLGGDILVIRTDKRRVHGSFLSYLIRSSKDQILQLVTGTTVFHLYGSDMAKFELLLPGLAEQTAIATLLSDLDAELSALEARRDKTRALKQGMMQELLTGRTRLI